MACRQQQQQQPEQSNKHALAEPLLANERDNNGNNNDEHQSRNDPHPLELRDSHDDNHDRSEEDDDDALRRSVWNSVGNYALHRIAHLKLPKMLSVVLLVGLSVFTGEEILEHTTTTTATTTTNTNTNTANNDARKYKTSLLPPIITRADNVLDCASQLSLSLYGNEDQQPFDDADSPQLRATEWFVYGAGQKLPIPTLSECRWDGDFGQLYALSVLREALMDHGTVPPSWVGTGDACQAWHRVACDDASKITKLHLNDLGLTGSIPREVAGLSYLERLELYDNLALTGTLPDSLGRLTRLKVLYLHHTSVTGEIPTTFGNLHALQELFLEGTDLEGVMPAQVCGLRQLGVTIHADCDGAEPRIQCDPATCCTNCYKHHNDKEDN